MEQKQGIRVRRVWADEISNSGSNQGNRQREAN
jgi:hypothetical protein